MKCFKVSYSLQLNPLNLDIVSACKDRVLDVGEKCTNIPHLVCNAKEIQWDNAIPYVKIFNFINCPFNVDPQSCNLLSSTTSSGGICVDVPRNGGMFKDTPKGTCKMSLTVKPLSAITESPSLSMPALSTISLSDILPVYSWLMNVITPDGEIPSSPLSEV